MLYDVVMIGCATIEAVDPRARPQDNFLYPCPIKTGLKMPWKGYTVKTKTSVTLSDELLKAIGQYEKKYKNRSEFIETAIWTFVKQLAYEQQNIYDIELINKNAERLNQEAMDVLSYQVPQ